MSPAMTSHSAKRHAGTVSVRLVHVSPDQQDYIQELGLVGQSGK